MKRTATELANSVRAMLGDQTPEGLIEYLEDLTDSVGDFNPAEYVSKSDYEAVVTERDTAVAGEKAMRDRYINRFYQGADAPNDKGFIVSEAPQSAIIEKEEGDGYAELFE